MALADIDRNFIAVWLTNGYNEIEAFRLTYGPHGIDIAHEHEIFAFCDMQFKRPDVIAELDRLRETKERKIEWIMLDMLETLDNLVVNGEPSEQLRAAKLIADIGGLTGRAANRTGNVRDATAKAARTMQGLLEESVKKTKGE